jgi:hypothetical protein
MILKADIEVNSKFGETKVCLQLWTNLGEVCLRDAR